MVQEIAEREGRRRKENQTTPENVSPDSETDLTEYIRLPRSGERCPRTGLYRGSYCDLIFCDPPRIKSVVVKKPGATRGVRLVHWPSLKAYLHDLMERQMAGTEASDVELAKRKGGAKS